MGASTTLASGLATKRISPAFRPSQWKNVGMYGSMRTGSASTPSSRWFMVVLEATQHRRIRSASTLALAHSARVRGCSVSSTMAFCKRSTPPFRPCSTMRLITSAP